MNLATRCNACGTVFRVVRDQLRVSDGWVRCGRCMAVFSAADDLFELDEGGPDPAAPAAASGETARHVLAELQAERQHRETGAGAAMPAAWTVPTRPAQGLDDEVTASLPAAPAGEMPPARQPPGPVDDAGVQPGAYAGDSGDTGDDADAPYMAPEFTALDSTPIEDDRPAAIVAWDSVDVAPPESGEAAALPGFVRRAARAAFWRRPLVRAALGLAAIALAAGLAAQIGRAAHDELAARWPALTPALQALCDATGCRIAPLRQIDQLSVDSAGLMLLEGAPIYRLQLVLHNRADTALATPAVDLSLEDAQGAVVARRVLQAAELGLAQPALEAGAQLPLTVMLAARDRRIAGYHVELFYP